MVKNCKNYRSGRLRLHLLPILVWLAAVAGVIVLFQSRSRRFEVLGLAQGPVHEVCAPIDGQLKVVSVDLFEKVDKNQVLAVLDDAQLNARIATIQAEIEHLMSQLLATEDNMLAEAGNLETDKIAAQRRFYVDVENARLGVLELKTLIETDRITAENLAVEVKITADLLNKNAIVPYELEKAQNLYNAQVKKIEENEHLLAQAEQDLEQARQRRDEFAQYQPAHPSVQTALDTIHKQVTVQEKLINEILVQREALRITSPVDGMVIQIQVNTNRLRRTGEDVLRKPGEVVLAGEPILVVAETEPTEVIAYISEEQLGKVKETMAVKLIKNTQPAQVASSQVVKLGPVMELMPQQLWRNPNIAQWGRPVLIKIPPGLKLIPGETVGIKGL